MKHYKLEEWADFIREVLPAEQLAVMKGHLGVCKKCLRTVELWRRLRAMAAQEDGHTPPASAVHLAKSLFAAQGPEKKPSLVERVARLVWDSLQQPQLEGVRSPTASPRQMLYRAGSYVIDLRVEAVPGTAGFLLVGQVLNSTQPGMGIGHIPVALESDQNFAAKTLTNAFGEFQLNVPRGTKAHISLTLGDRREILIPVGSFGSEQQEGSL